METNEENQLKLLLNVASNRIEEYCKRKFKRGTFTEFINGSGTFFLSMSNYPIIDVNAVNHGSRECKSFNVLKEQGQLFNCNGWEKGELNYFVEYEAGYEEDEIPEMLGLACAFLAQSFMNQLDNQGVQAESIGGISTTYTNEFSSELPSVVKSLLNPFKGRCVT